MSEENYPPDMPFPEAEISPEIQAAVDFIKTRVAVAENAAIEIGDYLLSQFFNDDLAAVRSKDPYKQTSFSRLYDHPDFYDLSLSKATLYRMVRVAAQNRFFTASGLSAELLSFRHHVILLPLENNETKLALVRDCIQYGWSSRLLESRIRESLPASSESPVPLPYRAAVDFVSRITKKVPVPEALYNYESLHNMPESDKRRFCESSDAAIAHLDQLKAAIQEAMERIQQDLGLNMEA